jgi:hypothetical protein
MIFILNWALILLLIFFSLMILEFTRASKSWIAFSLTLCFLTRLLVAISLSGGLKYIFVLDSLSYEYNAWLLAQPWISMDLFLSLTPEKTGQLNYYEVFVSWIFKFFGQDALIATVCNCLLSTATIGLLVVIYRNFLAEKFTEAKSDTYASTLILIGVLSTYPSYLIWSATNTRDPLYFFACTLFIATFLTTYSRRSTAIFPVRILALLGSVFSIWPSE